MGAERERRRRPPPPQEGGSQKRESNDDNDEGTMTQKKVERGHRDELTGIGNGIHKPSRILPPSHNMCPRGAGM